jgi:transposase
LDVLGIDVGKFELHAVLLQGERTARKSVGNTQTGHEQLLKWLSNRKATKVHVCLEATGAYGIAVAEFLYDRGYVVSVVNPAQIKAFGRSELVRTKTDAVDAALIARFCRANQPFPWKPAAAHIRTLRALVRRRETLTDLLTAEGNRLEAATTKEVKRSIRAVIRHLRAELKRLEDEIDRHVDQHPDLRAQIDRLDEIPGFGALTAMKVIAETNAFTVCGSSREIVAFAGLNPRLYQSGSIMRRGRISRIGNSALRKALYYAALSAKTHAAYFRPFVTRLQEAGKRPKVIITAIMRKLLILAFQLTKTQTHFNPAYGS